MIAVFDANVLIAALITEGVCSKLLRRARAGEFVLVSCPFVMSEVRRVLLRKFRLSHRELALTMEPAGEAVARIIRHELKVTGVSRDAEDDNVIACALAAEADYLVSGDSDLLEVRNYRGVKIASPRDFEALFV